MCVYTPAASTIWGLNGVRTRPNVACVCVCISNQKCIMYVNYNMRHFCDRLQMCFGAHHHKIYYLFYHFFANHFLPPWPVLKWGNGLFIALCEFCSFMMTFCIWIHTLMFVDRYNAFGVYNYVNACYIYTFKWWLLHCYIDNMHFGVSK